jgi:hypothetical protein
MSFVSITIEILEYFPQNFNFENFSFIFSSESKDFEKEISFLNKNSIFHKISLPKKNLKYSIKITKNNSLVGISDYIIPVHIFNKKETTFEKMCQITVTDSIRRLIFGNAPPNSLKMCIRSTLQYVEKGEKFIRPATSNLSLKKEEKRSSTPKKMENNLKKMKFGASSNSNLKLIKDDKKAMNKKLTEDFKKRSNSKPHMNNISSSSMPLNMKNKNSQRDKEIIYSNNKKEKKEIDEVPIPADNSLIDEELNNTNFNVSSEFFDFIPNFEKKYPLEKLNTMSDPYEMINYTKNIITELLNYQINYYNILKNSMNLNRKFNELLIKYNEKYRLTLKKINKIEEENKKNDIQNELITDIHRNDFNNLKQLIPLKQSELDLYREMYSINIDENELLNYSEEQMKQMEEKKTKDANTQLLLIRVLKNIYNKFGPLNKIINQSNSNENERNNIITLSAKYDLPISEEVPENNEEFEYVYSSNPDETDHKMESYLKNLYSQKKVPKIIFKKISNNNYEYGTQKVTIKIEGDKIKAKCLGGFLSLDKFIDNNAMLEDGKIKNSNSKSSSLNQNKKKKK